MSGSEDGARRKEPRCRDAVVVIPGIMGSELIEADGRVLWGLSPKDLVSAYRGDLLDRLRVTDGDLTGRRAVRATRLLKYPAVLGWFRGSEDYHRLLARTRRTVLDERSVLAFPYDWRLSVTFNGGLLAQAAIDQWERWRATVVHEKLTDPDGVGLTLIAHSMGGLVARAAQVHGLNNVPTRIVTLGTPFYGAVKAVRLLAEGEGTPIPGLDASKIRDFAVSSPGVHDLLPRYRCVTDGEGVRRMTSRDVASLGGDPTMMTESETRWERLEWGSGPGVVRWHSAIGSNQPTLQSLTLTAGEARYHRHLLDEDHSGDGTVYRGSAGPGWPGYSSAPFSQTHAALISSDQSDEFVHDKLLHRDAAPPLGVSYVSVDFPEFASAGQRVSLRAARFPVRSGESGPEGSHHLWVSSTDLTTNRETAWTTIGVDSDGWLTAAHVGLGPGLHRVSVRGGGASPVTDLLWVGEDV
jgi:hypothetical protein